MTPLAIVGMGMVSPLGWTPEDHVFFARGEVGPAAPGGFVDDEGDTIQVAYCPWLGAAMPIAERLSALGRSAATTALAPLRDASLDRSLALFVCTEAARDDLVESDRAAVEAALAADANTRGASRVQGAAGFFLAIEQASRVLQAGSVRAALIVAVDSLVTVPSIAAWKRDRSMPWQHRPPRPAECAAAIALMRPEDARREGVEVLATVHGAATRMDEANDDNDAIVTGAAMTFLLHEMAAPGPIGAAFGQSAGFRGHEWSIATARASARFAQTCAMERVEASIGSVGAVAGAANLVFGIAMKRHDAWPDEPPPEGPILAWAISRDGTRGLATVSVEPRSSRDPRGIAAPPHATRKRPALVTPFAPERAPIRAPIASAEVFAASPDGLDDIDALLTPKRGASDPVSIARDRAAPFPPEAFHDAVRAGCLDRVTMLARHRDERPLRERARIEERILAQVDALARAGADPAALVAAWDEDDRDPYRLWAIAFTLASLPGDEPTAALRELLSTLSEDRRELAGIAADALIVAPSPDVPALADELFVSRNALARAIGVDILHRRGALPIARALALGSDSSPVPIAAMLRALSTEQDRALVLANAAPFLEHPDPDVAWEAARALTIRSHPDALYAMREQRPLTARLGPRALEILVLGGRIDDIAAMQAIVRRLPATPDVLSAVARLGNPGAWAYLVHHLENAELASAAAGALETMFGALISPRQRENPSAWRDALATAHISRDVRLRRGVEWSTDVVAQEIASGAVTRREAERRGDELVARGAWATARDFAAWS